ncbi:MAG: hypothetical protein E6713_15825 [Sporomusaceae bacterium]|nr:hypothetical protein [Sporomusaceae bacterium]
MTHALAQSLLAHQVRVEIVGTCLGYLSFTYYLRHKLFLQKETRTSLASLHKKKNFFLGTLFGFAGYWLLIGLLCVVYSSKRLARALFLQKD